MTFWTHVVAATMPVRAKTHRGAKAYKHETQTLERGWDSVMSELLHLLKVEIELLQKKIDIIR
eukprot:1018188-Amphidinium_carterae.1